MAVATRSAGSFDGGPTNPRGPKSWPKTILWPCYAIWRGRKLGRDLAAASDHGRNEFELSGPEVLADLLRAKRTRLNAVVLG
jgi:hypothetical protein